MTFSDCIFAAAEKAVYHNCDSYDYEFSHCSFDYHATPFVIGPQGRYSRFLFSGGHSEAFDGPWFNATASGIRMELTMQGHEILTTHYVDPSVVGSTRIVVSGNPAARLRLSGASLRYTGQTKPCAVPNTDPIDTAQRKPARTKALRSAAGAQAGVIAH